MNCVKSTKEKPYISMRKIASFRRQKVSPQKDKRITNSVFTIIAFEHGDGIAFSCRFGQRRVYNDKAGVLNPFDFDSLFHFKLSIKTRKNGEKRFIFYKVNLGSDQGRVKTVSPNHFRCKFEELCKNHHPKNKTAYNGIPKAQTQRLLSFIRAFLRRHKVSYKWLSDDPFSLMYQLCYPGSTNFDSETLKKLECSKFLLGDPVKKVLGTNGKHSRKLVMEYIKKHPFGINSALSYARYIRITRSLDHAQQFISMISGYGGPIDQSLNGRRVFTPSRFKASQWEVFNKMSLRWIAYAVILPDTVNDTFSMLEQLKANSDFDLSQVQYRSIEELHNRLARLRPRTGNSMVGAFEHYTFDPDSHPMKFCEELKKRMSDSKFTVTYAKNTMELNEQAKAMHNCSFFYHGDINRGVYAILCINQKYMFGVRMMGLKYTELDQAVTFHNGTIERDTYNEINREIKSALEDYVPYRHEHLVSGQQDWL